MAITDVARALTELLEPIALDHGFELVAVEQAGGRKSTVIRVLLDRKDGLDLDAVCAANAWVSDVLDESDALPGPYTLEVSSPGIDRPLRKLSDFERFAGETVTIKTRPAGDKRTAWTGVLKGVDGTAVVLEADSEKIEIPYDSIVKARLKGVVSFNREGFGER
jgi:ribosome maturation factor RimP